MSNAYFNKKTLEEFQQLEDEWLNGRTYSVVKSDADKFCKWMQKLMKDLDSDDVRKRLGALIRLTQVISGYMAKQSMLEVVSKAVTQEQN